MIKLLDCTFRDGGYYTQWDFDTLQVEKYCELISRLPVEYVEVGYRNTETSGYFGAFYYSPLTIIKKVRSHLRKSQKIVLMLDAKNYLPSDLQLLFSDTLTLVDMIRIATSPDSIADTLELAKVLTSMGFKVAINLMYISKLHDDHPLYKNLEGIEQFVEYLYLVDSYGAIYPDALEKMIKRFQKHSSVALGFHGHNNLELAFINTLTAIACGVKIVDATILGMGRGAGNLKLELLLTHLNAKERLSVDLNALSFLVELFTPLLNIYKWGTNLPYMVAGSYSLTQKDVMEAIEINRYSIASIVNTMSTDHHQTLSIFHSQMKLEKCLIIGGGSSVKKHFSAIQTYLGAHPDILVIHATSRYLQNFSDFTNRQLFCISGDELSKLISNKQYSFIDKFVFEPSPRKINVNIPSNEQMVELEKIDFIKDFSDAPLTLALQTALDANAVNIELIGFDGYTSLQTSKELYLMQENQKILSAFSSYHGGVSSLSKTQYKDILHQSIYSRISL